METRSKSMVAVPSIVMAEPPKVISNTAKTGNGKEGSKTVIKLKLTGPNPNLIDGGTKKSKKKKDLGETEYGVDEKKGKKKRDKKKKEENEFGGQEIANRNMIEGVKVQVANGKITRFVF